MEPLLPGLSTFFSWLTNYTIDVSILICLIFILKSIVSKKLPAWWHYSLWLILLLRMIIPFRLDIPLNIPNVVPITIDERLFESVLVDEEFIMSKFTAEMPPAQQGSSGWHVQVDDVLLFLWLAGVVFLGIYILVKNIRFWNSIKKEPRLTDQKVLSLLEECKARIKTNTSLKITVTDKVKTPALFGYIRPRLLLPAGSLEKLCDADLSYIFMHELVHLKRHDIGVSWVVTFLQIFQWFNPFTWVAFYQMKIDQESACDESVLSRIKKNQSIDYASTIVGFLENFYKNRKLPALVGILENQAQIKKRITLIISYRKNSKKMMFFSTALLGIIGVIFFSLAGIAKGTHEQPGLDVSILQSIPVEVKKAMATGEIDIHENETVSLPEDAQKAVIAAQDRSASDEIVQVKLAGETQKVLPEVQVEDNKTEDTVVRLEEGDQRAFVAVQDRDVKDEIKPVETDKGFKKALVKVPDNNVNNREDVLRSADVTHKPPVTARDTGSKDKTGQEKPARGTQKALLSVRDNNIGDEKQKVRSAEGTQKVPAESLLIEGYSTRPENIDILKYYQFAAYKSEQNRYMETATSADKSYAVSEGKSVKYPDPADSGNYKSENPDDTRVDQSPAPDEPGDRQIQSSRKVDEYPKIVRYYPVKYPFEAKARGIEGRVSLRFTVDRAGNVLDPHVVSSEPEGIFEQAALDTVRKYRLKPAVKDGKRVSSVVNLTIAFTISDNFMRFAQN